MDVRRYVRSNHFYINVLDMVIILCKLVEAKCGWSRNVHKYTYLYPTYIFKYMCGWWTEEENQCGCCWNIVRTRLTFCARINKPKTDFAGKFSLSTRFLNHIKWFNIIFFRNSKKTLSLHRCSCRREFWTFDEHFELSTRVNVKFRICKPN